MREKLAFRRVDGDVLIAKKWVLRLVSLVTEVDEAYFGS